MFSRLNDGRNHTHLIPHRKPLAASIKLLLTTMVSPLVVGPLVVTVIEIFRTVPCKASTGVTTELRAVISPAQRMSTPGAHQSGLPRVTRLRGCVADVQWQNGAQ